MGETYLVKAVMSTLSDSSPAQPELGMPQLQLGSSKSEAAKPSAIEFEMTTEELFD